MVKTVGIKIIKSTGISYLIRLLILITTKNISFSMGQKPTQIHKSPH